MKNKTKTAQLVLGAVLLAVFLVLHIIVPGGNRAVQSILMIITCLPIAFYVLYSGKGYALLVIAAGTILSAILLEPLVTLSYAIPALVIGAVFGLTAHKLKRPLCMGLIALLHLLQNVFELILYYKMMQISILDSFSTTINRLMDLVGMLTQDPASLSFANDVILCAIPVAMLVASIAKGVLTYLILKVLLDKLASPLGMEPLSEESAVLKFNSTIVSVICLVLSGIYGVIAALLYFGVLSYGLWFATCTAFILLCCGAYLYYFYVTRIRLTELSGEKRFLYTGLLILLLPINIIAVPILEICLNQRKKKDAANQEQG